MFCKKSAKANFIKGTMYKSNEQNIQNMMSSNSELHNQGVKNQEFFSREKNKINTI